MPGPREARAILSQTQGLLMCHLTVEGDVCLGRVGATCPAPAAVCVWQPAMMPSPDSAEVMVGFAGDTAGFGAGATARGCLGRKWGSQQPPSSVVALPGSREGSHWGGGTLGFPKAPPLWVVSHLPTRDARVWVGVEAAGDTGIGVLWCRGQVPA